MKRAAVAMFALVALLAFAQTLSAQEKKERKKGGPGGRVKSVDASANKITVTMREKGKKEGVDKTYTVAKDCKVTIGGEAKTLADVKEGAIVGLTLGANDEVTEIRVVMRKKKDA